MSIEKQQIEQAVHLVKTEQMASCAFLQRRMWISYVRASEIMDELESLGIVGPAKLNGEPRDILTP